jgi:tRNA A37 methylthiotransferase MiaB
VIAASPNVCNYLHMPAQSGSSSTLQRMRRGYTREAYDALVQRARDVIPNVALSTDMITGVWVCCGCVDAC